MGAMGETNRYDEVPADLIRTARAATILDVTRSCVLRWVERGLLRGWKVGNTVRLSEAEVRAFRRPVEVRERVRTRAEDEEAAAAAVARMAAGRKGQARR
jgi:excisionase family DNA binding protein